MVDFQVCFFFLSLISFDLHPGTGIHCIYNIHILCIYAVYIYIDTLYIYTIRYICTYVYTCSNMCMSEFATELVATWTQVNSWAEAILLPLQGVFMAQGRHLCGNPCERTAVNDMTSKEPASPKGNDMLDQFFRDGDGFRVYWVGCFHLRKWCKQKILKKKRPFKKGIGRVFFFLKVAVFQVVLVTVLFKGESLGSWTDDSWGNERLRTEKARQARIQFFQVKSGWISFSFKIFFSSKDTENSHGIRWTSISALLSRLLLNGYHQQRSCRWIMHIIWIWYTSDLPPRTPVTTRTVIPCVLSFQMGRPLGRFYRYRRSYALAVVCQRNAVRAVAKSPVFVDVLGELNGGTAGFKILQVGRNFVGRISFWGEVVV